MTELDPVEYRDHITAVLENEERWSRWQAPFMRARYNTSKNTSKEVWVMPLQDDETSLDGGRFVNYVPEPLEHEIIFTAAWFTERPPVDEVNWVNDVVTWIGATLHGKWTLNLTDPHSIRFAFAEEKEAAIFKLAYWA